MVLVTRLICGLLILSSFMWLAAWLAAERREDALAKFGKPVPEDWPYVVVEHGEVKEWKLGTVRDNPFGFGACAAVFLGAAAVFVADVFQRLKLPPPSNPPRE